MTDSTGRTCAASVLSRREFMNRAAAASVTFALPAASLAAVRTLVKPVEIGLIADLHYDIMHDGDARLGAFVQAMSARTPDAIVQLGDFAYPSAKNSSCIDRFNAAHAKSLHVIGNHDTDAGFTKSDCIEQWGMPGRYYACDIGGLHLLVLDGNDPGSPTHKGGYATFVGEEQVEWLKTQLAALDGPIIVASHQPLAGAYAVDNAELLQSILGEAADKVVLAINGHSHIDEVVRVQHVTYVHVNSASYKWVGGDYRHQSYAEEIHAAHPTISYTCPYRDALFAVLTVDPRTHTIRIQGRSSSWVGKSPAELGLDMHPNLISGEQIAPRIRDREIIRVEPITG